MRTHRIAARAAALLIFAAAILKLDMTPEGMASMTAPAKTSATAEAGIYQIEAQPETPGNWALSLSAKVQGEAETATGTLTVPIAK